MGAIGKTLVLIALLLLSACSANVTVPPQNPAAGFPYRHSDFDYKVAWKTTAMNNGVVIDGIVKNVRYDAIDSINLTVYLLGKNGKVRAQAACSPFPQQSRLGDVVPFNAQLSNVTLAPGDTLKFSIQYMGGDGGSGWGNWTSTFAVDAMTGAALHRDNQTPEDW